LAIAQLCGGKWPDRAKVAALALSADIDESEGSAVVDLLQEFKDIFQSRDRITSTDLVEYLGRQVDKRWAEWSHGRPITQRQIARLLAPLKIKPGTIRVGVRDDETAKGYMREWFKDAISRYLPVLIRHTDTKHENQIDGAKNDPSQNDAVTDRKNGLSNGNHKVVTDVTDRKAGSRDSKGLTGKPATRKMTLRTYPDERSRDFNA
jgi:putative DNA primase/helicase